VPLSERLAYIAIVLLLVIYLLKKTSQCYECVTCTEEHGTYCACHTPSFAATKARHIMMQQQHRKPQAHSCQDWERELQKESNMFLSFCRSCPIAHFLPFKVYEPKTYMHNRKIST